VAETVREREEYIVEWGEYPLQWRLKKNWEVNYEMTQQLHNFRKDNPHAEINFDNRTGQREYSEFRIDDEQTVWLSEWQLNRIGLSGWVWVGSLTESANSRLSPLFQDRQGPLVIGEPDKKRGAGWLRIEQAEGETRFIKLGDKLEYQSLIASAVTEFDSLLHGVQGEDLQVMDWRNGELLRNYLIPAQLAPLEQFDLGERNYNLMPDNAYSA
jgi:hypothetical protein